MIDADGVRSPAFDVLIAVERPETDGSVRADGVACAAYVTGSLDSTELREGYARLAQTRKLRKTPSAIDSRTTITLGLIIAASSTLSLDAIATEMRTLNKTVADGERPDMVAVMSSGTVSYGMSFPGDESVGGFLPPVQGGKIIPPINIRQIITETTTHALNKVCGFVISHMAFFAPAMPRPDMKAATDGCPQNCAIVWTYRYDTAGRFRDAVTIPDTTVTPYRIEDAQGTLLCRLGFQHWQDGGVAVAEGQLPLEGLLPLAGRGFPAVAFPVKSGHTLSCVLPLDESGFVEMMAQIAKKATGVTVRPEQMQFTIAPLLEEGTTSPFAARLYMTPPTLRDVALRDKAQVVKFDELFQFVMNHLVDVRKTARVMLEMWRTYAARVPAGEIVRYDNALHVDEPIDQPLNKHINSFIMDTARVSKEFQKLTRLFGVEIGFLFQNDKEYQKSLALLDTTDTTLADYLRESRKWLEPLRLFRDEIEHENYVPPRIMHDRAQDGRVTAHEPRLLHSPLTLTVPYIENRLNRFVEEILVWCIAKALPAEMIVTEIPLSARDPNKVERFKVALAGTAPAWQLTYSSTAFDEV
ncbi:MAG: hypothetical protein ABSE64_00515 [Vulcanimicrobiaceae bacterium]